MTISPHISYKEATFSATALRLGINNTPNQEQLDNMRMIATSVFEPLRTMNANKPILINSFFRCEDLNKAIGGSLNSQHMAINNAAAIDLDNDLIPYGFNNRQIFHNIVTYMIYDQCIWEFGDDTSPAWVHVSLRTDGEDKNRFQRLRSVYENGKVIYNII